jgi:hypothetical protein
MAGEPDGTLLHWEDVAGEESWQALLLGNGLSINVWEPFGYRRLLEEGAAASLTKADRELFEGTPNFERVLSDLGTAIRVCDVVGTDTSRLYVRYRKIQRALGRAVRQVHLPRSKVPDTTLATIRRAMTEFEWVFTTSYDLLVYWAMGHPGGRYSPFKDHFRYAGRHEFDPRRAAVRAGEIPVYYLHGALHLVVGRAGKTWKLRLTSLRTILDQFGTPIDGDPEARPLLVTEGSAADKLRAIESNEYLSHALERLRRVDLPMVVFGSSLGPQDDHLVDALSRHPDRPIAISMRKKRKKELLAEQSDLYRRLQANPVYFYDAETHPLGQRDLAAR